MKLKFIFTVLLYSCLIKVNCQVWQVPSIQFGIAYRSDTRTHGDPEMRESRYINTRYETIRFVSFREQTSYRVFIDVTQKLPGKNNLYISLSNYITLEKYNAIKKEVTDYSDAYTKRYKRDHFLDLFNLFGSDKKKFKYIGGLGVGLMNCGTSFRLMPVGPLASISMPIVGNDRSTAFRIHTGVKYKKLQARIIGYFIGRENLGYRKFAPEVKLAYEISPFKKR